MRKLLQVFGFYRDNPNEYSECPKCGEWTYQDGYCKKCGYERD